MSRMGGGGRKGFGGKAHFKGSVRSGRPGASNNSWKSQPRNWRGRWVYEGKGDKGGKIVRREAAAPQPNPALHYAAGLEEAQAARYEKFYNKVSNVALREAYRQGKSGGNAARYLRLNQYLNARLNRRANKWWQ